MAGKNYNIAPYYDDFDSTKNFVRMLFRPERAVQARELTQLQTILNNQVGSFANHIFQDSSKILGAKIELDYNIVALTLTSYTGGATQATDFVGKYIKGTLGGNDTNTSAFVHKADNATNKVYVSYRGGEFAVSDNIQTVDIDSEGYPETYVATITSINNALFASVQDGIIYVNGLFVLVSEQTILVDGTANNDDYYIGFTVTEDEVDWNTDSTLLDPAQGFYNYNAPGADRYNMTVTLTSYKYTDTLPTDGTFYPKVFVENKEIIKEEADTSYSDILKLLAKRTYEESGDYTVDPFIIELEDNAGGDATKFDVTLDPGIAYVKGFRHETISGTTLTADKAREFDSATESVFVDYGPYIKLDYASVENIFLIPNLDKVEFFKTPISNAANWLAYGSTPAAGKDVAIGTARVTAIVYTGSAYRLYLTDYDTIKGKVGSISAVRSVATTTIRANTLLEDADTFNPAHTKLYNETANALNIYPMPNFTIKEVRDSNVIYRIQKQVNKTVASQSATINTGTGEDIDQTQNAIVWDDSTPKVILVEGVDYTIAYATDSIVISNLDVGIGNIDVHYFVEITGGAIKSKTLTETTETSISSNSSGVLTLANVDIAEIVSLTEDPGGTPTPIDVTTLTWDNGQRDFYYDYGTISGLTVSQTFDVTYKRYAHGGSGDYFCVDSYVTQGNVAMENVPVYITSENEAVFLGDSLDFRRSVADLGSGVSVPTPRSYMFVDYDYYLSRKDLVWIDKDGNFGITKGISSLRPAVPVCQENAMALYSLEIPAYTFSPKGVTTKMVENRNYTMRDIGRLERRIEALEYYSSLNMMEQEISALEITDQYGFDRFKNGILVDSFIGANVINPFDPEYWCSIDPEVGILRAPFSLDQTDLVQDTSAGKHDTLTNNGDGTFTDSTNNVVFHPHMVTLDYTKVEYIKQDLASHYMNVNPYNVFSWAGDLRLVPDTDHWIDTTYVPDLVTNIDGLYDNLIQSTIAAYGTQWGSWRTYWTGSEVTTQNVAGHAFTDAGEKIQINQDLMLKSYSERLASGLGPHAALFRGEVHSITTTTLKQFRTGTRLIALPNRIEKVQGERVIDVSVIPYMRSINIQFDAKNLKPNTDVHFFFDGVDIDDYITPTGGYEPSVASFGARTDATGKCKGVFAVPSDDTLRFRTGLRIFEIIDDTFQPTTFCDKTFTSAGHLQKKQRSILSIDKPILTTITVREERQLTEVSREFAGWYDPVAQSFLIETEGGVFLTDLELFFQSKDLELPVSVQIVETVNGYPGQFIIPFSQVTLDSADVSVSDDASVGTTFQFSDPVYLEHNTEYAFIVYSNSDNYNIWYGAMGEFDVAQLPDEVRITKQPYAGVLFKSQNGSTWTADQNKDLKFTMNRAKFVTKTADGKVGTYYLKDDDKASTFVTNCQFEIDHLNFDLADIQFAYKFEDTESLYTQFINGVEIGLLAQNEIDTVSGTQDLLVTTSMYTENNFVSPIVGVERAQCILINNLIKSFVDGNLYEAGGAADSDGYFNAGTYVTRVSNLVNPSDTLRVIIDAWKLGAADMDVYFSTGKFQPEYVEIYDTNIASIPIEFVEKKMYLYIRDTSTNVTTEQTQFQCSDVDNTTTPSRLYVTGIGDPDQFTYFSDWAANKEWFVVAEDLADYDLAGNIDVYSAATDYAIGDLAIYAAENSGDIWVAEEVNGPATTVATPTDQGTAWRRIKRVFVCETGTAGEEIKVDNERTWRLMKIEEQDRAESFATTAFVEYTYVPAALVEEEFTKFIIKIQLKAQNPIEIPIASALRVVATY